MVDTCKYLIVLIWLVDKRIIEQTIPGIGLSCLHPNLHLQNPSACPPYLFGISSISITSPSAFVIAWGPLPTTLIFANVCADTRDLKTQKIQVSRLGTFMKNLRDWNKAIICSAHVNWGGSRGLRQEWWNSQGTQDNGSGKCWLLQRRHS